MKQFVQNVAAGGMILLACVTVGLLVASVFYGIDLVF